MLTTHSCSSLQNGFNYSIDKETILNNQIQIIDTKTSKLLPAVSEYDLFLLLIEDGTLKTLDSPPPIEGVMMERFREILLETFHIYYTQGSTSGAISSNVLEIMRAIQEKKDESENFSDFLAYCVEIYGSAAYNLIPISWYYLFLNQHSADQQNSYLIKALLFQFIKHTTFKAHSVSVFKNVNDLDIRLRIPNLRYKESLRLLQSRIDRFVQRKIWSIESGIPILANYKKKFTRWVESSDGDHFCINTFADFHSDCKKEVDLVIAGMGTPQPLYFSDGAYVPVTHLVFPNLNAAASLGITTFSGQTVDTILSRIAKVMWISEPDKKSSASIWTVLSHYTEEYRLNPKPKKENDGSKANIQQIELELWKTALLFAAFECHSTAFLGNQVISYWLSRNYKQVAVESLNPIKEAFFESYPLLSIQEKDLLAQTLSKSVIKRIQDHFDGQSEIAVLILVQLGLLLNKTPQTELFYTICQNVFLNLKGSFSNCTLPFSEHYNVFITNVVNVLRKGKLPLVFFIEALILSTRVEASLAKLMPESCNTKSIYTHHLESLYLQKQFRPFPSIPEYRTSILLPLQSNLTELESWMNKETTFPILDDFWAVFYAGLSVDPLDITSQSSYKYYETDIKDNFVSQPLEKLLASTQPATKALGLWALLLYHFENTSLNSCTLLISVVPEMLRNRWMFANAQYSSKCKIYLNAALDRIFSFRQIDPVFVCNTYTHQALLYKFPILIAKSYPELIEKILKGYSEKELAHVETIAVSCINTSVDACLMLCEHFSSPARFLTKCLKSYPELQDRLFIHFSEIIHTKSALPEHISEFIVEMLAKKRTFSLPYKILLLDFWEKRDAIASSFIPSIASVLIECLLSFQELAACCSIWLSLYRQHAQNINALFVNNTIESLFVLTIEALDTVKCTSNQAYSDQLLLLVPKEKKWNLEHRLVIDKWVKGLHKAKEISNLDKWRELYITTIKATQHVNWGNFLSFLQQTFESAHHDERKQITVFAFQLGFDLLVDKYKNNLNTLQLFFDDILSNRYLLEELNSIPKIKGDALFEIYQHASHKTLKNKVLICILELLPYCSLEFSRSIYFRIEHEIFINLHLKNWINKNREEFTQLVRTHISINSYWQLQQKVIDRSTQNKNLWHLAKQDLEHSEINELNTNGLLAIHHCLMMLNKYYYTSPNLSDYEHVITLLLKHLLDDDHAKNSAEFWIKCYLETNISKIKCVNVLLHNFLAISTLFPHLGLAIIKLIHSKSAICNIISIGEIQNLEIQLLNLMYEIHPPNYYEMLQSIIKRANTTLTVEYAKNRLKAEISNSITKSTLFEDSLAAQLANMCIQNLPFIPYEQFLQFVDLQQTGAHLQFSQTIITTVCDLASSPSIKIDAHEIEKWNKRLTHLFNNIPVHTEYLKILKNKNLIQSFVKVYGVTVIENLLYRCINCNEKEVISAIKQYSFINFNEWFRVTHQYIFYLLNHKTNCYLIEYCVEIMETALAKRNQLDCFSLLEHQVLTNLIKIDQNVNNNQTLYNVLKKYFFYRTHTFFDVKEHLRWIKVLSRFSNSAGERGVVYSINAWLVMMGIRITEYRDIEHYDKIVIESFQEFYDILAIDDKKLLILFSEVAKNRTFIQVISRNYNNLTIQQILFDYCSRLFEKTYKMPLQEMTFDQKIHTDNELCSNIENFILVVLVVFKDLFMQTDPLYVEAKKLFLSELFILAVGLHEYEKVAKFLSYLPSFTGSDQSLLDAIYHLLVNFDNHPTKLIKLLNNAVQNAINQQNFLNDNLDIFSVMKVVDTVNAYSVNHNLNKIDLATLSTHVDNTTPGDNANSRSPISACEINLDSMNQMQYFLILGFKECDSVLLTYMHHYFNNMQTMFANFPNSWSHFDIVGYLKPIINSIYLNSDKFQNKSNNQILAILVLQITSNSINQFYNVDYTLNFKDKQGKKLTPVVDLIEIIRLAANEINGFDDIVLEHRVLVLAHLIKALPYFTSRSCPQNFIKIIHKYSLNVLETIKNCKKIGIMSAKDIFTFHLIAADSVQSEIKNNRFKDDKNKLLAKEILTHHSKLRDLLRECCLEFDEVYHKTSQKKLALLVPGSVSI